LEHQVPSFEGNAVGRLEQSLAQFESYKQALKTALPKEDPTETYIELAQKQLKIEQKKAKKDPTKTLQTPTGPTGPTGPAGPNTPPTTPTGPAGPGKTK
jgi:hypothetical protein